MSQPADQTAGPMGGMSLLGLNTTYTDTVYSQGAFELMMYSGLYECDLWSLAPELTIFEEVYNNGSVACLLMLAAKLIDTYITLYIIAPLIFLHFCKLWNLLPPAGLKFSLLDESAQNLTDIHGP